MSSGSQVKRLSKVAKEFNIGIHTIVDFLDSKGIKIESNPNTKLDENVYAVLLDEFQQDKNAKEASKKITIGSEKETISIKPEPVVKKVEVVEDQEETPTPEKEEATEKEATPEEDSKGPKIISKIDLDSINTKTRPDKKAKEAEKKKEAPKEEVKKEESAPKAEKTEKAKEEEKPQKAAPENYETVYEKLETPKVLRTIELPVEKKFEKRKPVASSNKEKDTDDDAKGKSKRKRLSKKVDLSDVPRKFPK